LSFLLLVDCAVADSSIVDTTMLLDTTETRPVVDTFLFSPPEESSKISKITSPVDLEKHLHQNPTAALFKSMFVPGLGQLGNRSYIKAGIVIGLEAWLVSTAVDRASKTSDAKDLYLAADDDSRYSLYLDYTEIRNGRNKYIWWAGIVTFISMFDAFVDAHLSGSPTKGRNKKFDIEVAPDQSEGIAAVISYRF